MITLDNAKKIKYLLAKNEYALEKPRVLQFPINDICNSRCQMCNIWEQKQDDEISPEQVTRILKNELFSDLQAVGINGGEPTLRKDLARLVEAIFIGRPTVKRISLITNGYKSEEVIQRITEASNVAHKYGAAVDLMVSLDGYADVHDRVRRRDGFFKRSTTVLNYFKQNNLVDNLRVGCTIIKENADHLFDLHDYCDSIDVYVKYRLGIQHKRLYTENITMPYELNKGQRYNIVEFFHGLINHYEKDMAQIRVYKSLIGQLTEGRARTAGCDWKHRGATLTSRGELMYCAVESDVVVNAINENDLQGKYFKSEDHLKDIVKNKCDSCSHDYMGMPPPNEVRRELSIKIKSAVKSKIFLGSNALTENIKMRYKAIKFENSIKKDDLKINFSAKISKNGSAIICGWYGTETLGDKAILAGICTSLRGHIGGIKIYICSLNKYLTEVTVEQMPELEGCEVLTYDEAFDRADAVDYMIFGGGPIMAIPEIGKMEALFLKSKNAGVKTVVAGCGVGPMGEAYINDSIKRLLQMSDVRIYRDKKSFDHVEKMGLKGGEDIIAEDPAFTWIESVAAGVPYEKGETKKLLLGLREFPFEAYARGFSVEACNNISFNYEDALKKALQYLLKEYSELVIVPIPMCTNHFGDDDRWYYRRILKDLPKNRIDFSMLGAELSPIEYAKAFKSASAAIAMRFHSLVFSIGFSVPVIALDYTLGKGKVNSLAQKYSIPVSSLESVTEDFIVNNIKSMMNSDGKAKYDVDLKFKNEFCSNLG